MMLASEGVSIVVLVKTILLQCVVGQLDQGLYVMHVGSCGQTRFFSFSDVILDLIEMYDLMQNDHISSSWLDAM